MKTIHRLLRNEQIETDIIKKVSYMQQAMQLYFLNNYESLKDFDRETQKKYCFQQCLEYISENKKPVILERKQLLFPFESGIEDFL